MLSKENLKLARKQLSEQIERLPDGPQKAEARAQLERMSDEAISAMVEQQQAQLVRKSSEHGSVFRMIVEGTIPSKKIDENKEAIAVVSIRPVSKGHVLVIPKVVARDSRELPSGALMLAKKVAAKMISRLKANATEIQTSRAFDEVILNVIPIYNKRVDVNSPAYDAEEQELNEVYELMKVIKKPKSKTFKIKMKKFLETEVVKLPRRVP